MKDPSNIVAGDLSAFGAWMGARDQARYRQQVRREGDKVRLFTRRGYDWRKRYPAIARTAALRCTSFTIDGEAVVCGPDGVAIFDALHRRHRQRGYAIRLHGEDLRGLPLGDRKKRLVYCGPVLRHPAEFMLPAVDLGGRVWLVASPVKAGCMRRLGIAGTTC
jgi:hypothetical protein